MTEQVIHEIRLRLPEDVCRYLKRLHSVRGLTDGMDGPSEAWAKVISAIREGKEELLLEFKNQPK